MTATATAMTIGEAARRAGLTPKAVRLYEARGLLPPVKRTASGYRVYTDHDLRLLGFIRKARGLGLSLDEIRAIIQLRRAGTPPSAEVIGLLRLRLAEIKQRVSELGLLEHTLTEVLETATSRVLRGEQFRLCRVLDQPRGPASSSANSGVVLIRSQAERW